MMLEWMRENGQDINQKDGNGYCPLELAIRAKNPSAVETLLNFKEFNQKVLDLDTNALHVCSRYKRLYDEKTLISYIKL